MDKERKERRNMKKKIVNILFYSAFIFYLYFIFKNILFKYVSPLQLFVSERYFYRNVNWIPFYEAFTGNFDTFYIFGNFIVFIPTGIYAAHFFQKKWAVFLAPLALSIFFEVSQYAFAIGATDVTDVITNTLGGALGVGIYFLLKVFFKNKERTKNVIALSSFAVMIPVAAVSLLLFVMN